MKLSRRVKDLLFVASGLVFFGVILWTMFFAGQIAMTDTEPPAYPVWYPPYPLGMLDFGPIVLGHNYLVELLTPKWYTLALTYSSFVIALLSAHWLTRKMTFKEGGIYYDLRLYLFPYLFALNPPFIGSFLSGDAGGINIAISLTILVYLYTRLFVERGDRKYFAYLILVQLLGNWIYFEFFFFSFYFQIPLLFELALNRDLRRIKRWVLASVLVSSIGFFSEIEFEILAYFNAKASAPQLFIFNVGYYTSSLAFYVILLLIFTISAFMVNDKKARPLIATSFLFLALFGAFYFHSIPVPLLDAIWATFTGAAIKFAMFVLYPALLTFLVTPNDKIKTVIVILMLLLPYSQVSTPGSFHIPDVYELVKFNAFDHQAAEGLYQVAEVIAGSPGPSVVYAYDWQQLVQVQSAIPWVLGWLSPYSNASFIFNFTEMRLSGVKYVISFSPLHSPYLKPLYNTSQLYLYEFVGFDGIAHLLNGTPVSYSVSGGTITVSSYPAVVAVPYSPYLTDARPYGLATLVLSGSSTFSLYPLYQVGVIVAYMTWVISLALVIFLLKKEIISLSRRLRLSPPSRPSGAT